MGMKDLGVGFCAKQNRLVNQYWIRFQDAFAGSTNELWKLETESHHRLWLLRESYAQELRAAAFGDDTVERLTVATRNFQGEHARLCLEHGEAWQGIQAKLARSIEDLQAEIRLQALDNAIEYLQEVRWAMAPESS